MVTIKDPLITAHFSKVDPLLFSLFETVTVEDYAADRPADYFMSLCRQIIGQQLSGKVADVIYDRFVRLFPRRNITPKAVLTKTTAELRAIGMSGAKAAFVYDLAKRVADNDLNLPELANMTDEEVIVTLTKVKGIGPWTAEMFLMFCLGRPDVFSYGDLGLRRAMAKLYKFRNYPTTKQMEKIVKKWRPYRTIGARMLWAYLDAPDTTEAT